MLTLHNIQCTFKNALIMSERRHYDLGNHFVLAVGWGIMFIDQVNVT